MSATDQVEFELTPAAAEDLGQIERLLQVCNLTTEGIRDLLGSMVVAKKDGEIVGVAGLEVYGSQGLLRSVAVEPDSRSAGIGRRLTERIKHMASGLGIRDLYLLTEGADGFFSGIGFAAVERGSIDGPVATSDEFVRLCPASATAMHLSLPATTIERDK